MKTLSIGSDHAAFKHKARIIVELRDQGYQVIDRGCVSERSVDYPDIAVAVAADIVGKVAHQGVLLCGTGIGMSLAANKVGGIRAALVHDLYTARMAAEHNDANILCMGGRLHAVEYCLLMIDRWLNTAFEVRHQRRLSLIDRIAESSMSDVLSGNDILSQGNRSQGDLSRGDEKERP